MSKLYITHPHFNFSSVNKKSILLTDANASLIGNCDYHTSLADIAPVDLLKIIPKFTSVEYVSAGFVDNDPITIETKNFLNFLTTNSGNTSWKSSGETTFTDDYDLSNNTIDSTLWIFGCSHSYGTGLDSPKKTYGALLSEYLNKPLKLIANPGSSLHWSLRHIVNAQIKSQDLVVWQITHPERLSYFNGKHVEEILLARTTNRHLLEVYNDFQSYFMHLSMVNIGAQYLRQLGAKFILMSIDPYNYQMQQEYSKFPENFFPIGFDVDRGNDGLHFGPSSHKNIAFSLLNRIQSTNV